MNTGWLITRFDEIPSTNTYLLGQARVGAPHASVVIAKSQTGGRGRRGRTFLSPDGGLYMSILLRELPYDDCTVMTAAAAVAFRRALCRLSCADIMIKWVNDLLINGKKVAGILAEGVINPEAGLEGMVIGVGVNLSGVPSGVEDIACALPGSIDADTAAAELLGALDEILSLPLVEVMDEYRRYSAAIGRKVTVSGAGGEYPALAVDTDDRARLICVTDSGERIVLDSGEIRIRL